MRRPAAIALGLLISATFAGRAVWAQVGFRSTPVIQATATSIGQPIQFPLFRNQFSANLLEIAPGGNSGRHQHPVPTLVYVLEGTITIEAEGHEPRTYTAGQAFVESMNTWHTGYNRGATPVRTLVVFAGEEGRPTTVRP